MHETSDKTFRQILTAVALAFPLAVAAQDTPGQGAADNQGGQGGASQRADNPATQAAKSLSASDRKFVKEAAAGGMLEVQLGQLAQQKASSPEVRRMAQHIVEDHTRANEELMSIAKAKGVEVPVQLDGKHARQVKRLEKLSGEQFDRAYAKLMVSDHEKDVGLFKRQAENGSDPELKAFAAETLPKLQQHLAMARDVRQSVAKSDGHTRPGGDATGAVGTGKSTPPDTGNGPGAAEARRNRDSTGQGQGEVSSPEAGPSSTTGHSKSNGTSQ
jgi:putative membrane protein